MCAGWSEALLVAHTTLLEILCRIIRFHILYFSCGWTFKHKANRQTNKIHTLKKLKSVFKKQQPVIMKHHRTGGPDWRIYLRSGKSYLVTGPSVLWNLSVKVTVLAEYNKIFYWKTAFCSNQYFVFWAVMDILWSLIFIHYITFKLKNIFFLFLLFVFIWCLSGEIVVGQADFSSSPYGLSCKFWKTFVNSEQHVLLCILFIVL